MYTRFTSLVLSLLTILLSIGSGASAFAQDSATCDTGYLATLQTKLLAEKKKFEPAMDALTKRSDAPPRDLIEAGTLNLREYHDRQAGVCANMLKENKLSPNACQGITSEKYFLEDYGSCVSWVEREFSFQKQVFERLMTQDTHKKKMVFWVNKYKDLNKKFRLLLEKILFIQGELGGLVKSIDKIGNQGNEGN